MLEKAISIAVKAHENQKDKGGNPYILHPIRVMISLNSEDEMICGILHDVIEDSSMTLEALKNIGFSDKVIKALEALTKKENEDYESFIKRVLDNVLACKVKLKDLEDNMNIQRIPHPTAFDYKRIEKYKKAKDVIFDRLNQTKCFELKDCPFNQTDPKKSKCGPHQKQINCFEYDWVSYYKAKPDCKEKFEWKDFMLKNCAECEICSYHKQEIFNLIDELKKA